MTPEHERLARVNADLRDLMAGNGYAAASAAWLGPIDMVRPVDDISTQEVAEQHRYVGTIGGGKVKYDPKKTPYMREIHDAMDNPSIRMVVVKGPARSGKTLGAENFLLKVGQFGPSRNVLWYMHSEPDVKRYVKERVGFFLEQHEHLAAKVSRRPGDNAWNMKVIDGALWEWLAANASTTRARSAALIVADEVDAMRPDIRDAIETLIKNRQREYGSIAKAFICSHPDAGPQFGIDKILRGTDNRIRIWKCPECGHLMCPSPDAPDGRRCNWNMHSLLKHAEDMDLTEKLQYVSENVQLVCWNCKAMFDDDERLEMDANGIWMGSGQKILEDETIDGELATKDAAGFTIHAFMAPFVTLGGLAQEWAGAMHEKMITKQDRTIKEVSVKSLGETWRGEDAAAKPKEWVTVKARLLDTSYKLGQVPRGILFLTAMVDIQGDRFETGIIGWNRARESWLIDRFSLKQRAGLKDIAPAERLEDWDAIYDGVLSQIYPLNDGSGKYLSIAKTVVDVGGNPGVSNNARMWAANLIAERKVEPWRILLAKGDRWHTGEMYGTPREIRFDDAGRDLPIPIVERTTNVFEVKRLIAARMETEQPGPHFMHLPKDVEDKHVRELCSEILVNGEWTLTGTARNETWDIWVGCEIARGNLAPDNVQIDWVNDPPMFAVPFLPVQSDAEDDNSAQTADFYSRLSQLNRG